MLTLKSTIFMSVFAVSSCLFARVLARNRKISQQMSTKPVVSYPQIGFIGLGIMGDGMSRRLLKNGVKLKVWNRSPNKSDKLKSEYPDMVEVASSPADVITSCDTTFVMLSTPEACKAVYTMQDGILSGIKSGRRIVDCATLTPEDMQGFNQEVTSRGGRFAEAPVSGSKGPAENGQLVFMAAGDKQLVTDAKPFFEMMGKATHYIGEVGAATKMKLVVNGIMGNMLACLAEGLALSKDADLPQDALLEIVSQGAMANPMFALKGPKMIKGDHPPNFPLKHAYKDILFAADLADKLSVQTPMTRASASVYKKVIDQGLGDYDFSAVAEAYRKKE